VCQGKGKARRPIGEGTLEGRSIQGRKSQSTHWKGQSDRMKKILKKGGQLHVMCSRIGELVSESGVKTMTVLGRDAGKGAFLISRQNEKSTNFSEKDSSCNRFSNPIEAAEKR